MHAAPNRSEVSCMYYAIEFVSVIEASKLVTIEVESWSQSRHGLCMHYIDDLLPL